MSSSHERAKLIFEEAQKLKQKGLMNKNAKSKPTAQELKDAARAVQEQVNKQLNSKYGASSIDKALRDLHDIAVVHGQDDYRGRLPESIFVNYFLPYFREVIHNTKELTAETIKRRTKILTDWLSVSGGPFHEVNIINNAGEVLFIVPALNNTKVINPVRKDGAPSFETIANMAERLQLISPAKSLDYQNDRLHNKIKDMSDGKHKFRDSENIWLDIFSKYPDNNSTPVAAPANSSDDFTDDDIIYD